MTLIRKPLAILLASAAMLLPVTALGQGAIIRNVAIVDTATGGISPPMSIRIEDGRIAAIAQDAPDDTTAQVIDGTGLFAVPGYMDMHAHGIVAQGSVHAHGGISDQQANFDLMIANGVTSFREMTGGVEFIARAAQVNKQAEAGEITAPRVLEVPGELYVGQGGPDPKAAADFVAAQKAAGADFFKVIGGPKPSVLAVLAAADAAGMRVAGHLPESISTAEAVAAGWDVFEHLGGSVGNNLDCALDGPAARARMNESVASHTMTPEFLLNPLLIVGNASAPALQASVDSYDDATCRNLAQLFLDNEVWHVPTLIRTRTMMLSADPIYREDPNLRYLPAEVRNRWLRMGQDFADTITPEAQATMAAAYERQMAITHLLKEAGVPMLAGSDVGGIWILPGFGLHQEFRELAKAGFSPLEILQAATRNGGIFLGRASELGEVAPGFRADLVLLNANPMEDARNLSAIAGVMLGGRYFQPSNWLT